MSCIGCRDGNLLDFDFSMAFQPIVDVETERVIAYEALVRGTGQEGAAWVLAKVDAKNRYAFDQRCRVRAIETAVRAGLLAGDARLSINFLPSAVYSPLACIQLTLKTAKAIGLPTERLIFEFTESEDFGAGHSGLTLLARFQPHAVKLDRELIRDIDSSLPRRLIVEAVVRMCEGLGVRVVAEGVERAEEVRALRAVGIRFMQGFYFARPQFERLPPVRFDAPSVSAAA
jgi:EAL domain-containing protein (putative c-di-GMP-specific phosphodiesterase class I)